MLDLVDIWEQPRFCENVVKDPHGDECDCGEGRCVPGPLERIELDGVVKRRVVLRFTASDRVMCCVGDDEDVWAAGTVTAVYQDQPEDPAEQTKPPYLVTLDPPFARLFCVWADDNDHCVPEVCFGQRARALWWTLFCLPHYPCKTRRFGVGDRVAVAVEDKTDDFSVWAAGTVLEMDFSVEADACQLLPHRKWDKVASQIPYRVQLDSGCKVMVHRDEHWLIRDLSLQAPGPRQAADGTRMLQRIEKRQRSDGTWEAVDQYTRNKRSIGQPMAA